jgi:hypothetical protein
VRSIVILTRASISAPPRKTNVGKKPNAMQPIAII